MFQLKRRHLLPVSLAAAGRLIATAKADDPADHGACTPAISLGPVSRRPPPQIDALDFSRAEVDLAFRNHGMLTELLHAPVTPLGCHYLLNHFDVPDLSDEGYAVAIGGQVNNPMTVTLQALKNSHVVQQTVTMECAGTGRALLSPRPVYVPWSENPVGTYQWIGTPLRPLLDQAGLLGNAVEVLFTGWDSGIDMGVEHAFERSLPVADALHPEVMLAWAANGQTLLPQHGFPLRLIVPSWYGMASVKWLRAITVLSEPFKGVQQYQVYRYTQSADDPGDPVREKRVTSLLSPPGIPDLLSRWRFVAPGPQTLSGMAWSGNGAVSRVEVTPDGGASWLPAQITQVSSDRFAWVQWQATWQAAEGDYTLGSRATDASGDVQPVDPNEIWNYQGNGVNCVKLIDVSVQTGIGSALLQVPSPTKLILQGGKLPPVPTSVNQVA